MTAELTNLLTTIRDAIDTYLGVTVFTENVNEPAMEATATDKPKAKGKAKADDARAVRKAELASKRITSLRKIALDLGFDEEDVEEADKDDLIDGILDDEFSDGNTTTDDVADDVADEEEDEDEPDDEVDEDEDEDDDEDEEDEDEAEDDDPRAEYEGLSLKELKALAKDAGYSTADIRGMDQDAIIDLLLDGAEEDDEEEVEEDDEDADDEGYSEEDLAGMNLRELKALAKEWEVEVPAGTKKDDLIALLLEA